MAHGMAWRMAWHVAAAGAPSAQPDFFIPVDAPVFLKFLENLHEGSRLYIPGRT
jgi:hypothetical protein